MSDLGRRLELSEWVTKSRDEVHSISLTEEQNSKKKVGRTQNSDVCLTSVFHNSTILVDPEHLYVDNTQLRAGITKAETTIIKKRLRPTKKGYSETGREEREHFFVWTER